MKIRSVLIIAAVISSPVRGKDFRPPSHLENIPAANESVQQCYVIETTPGVHYTVESSDELGNWTSQDEIYGLGHEYVVTMREFTAPPPPPPGAPPATTTPPTVNASFRMNAAAGAAGRQSCLGRRSMTMAPSSVTSRLTWTLLGT